MERTTPRLTLCAAALEEAPVSGAQDSLGRAFRSYAPYVAAVALRLLGRDDEVDDLVQEVFLVALRGIGRLRDPGAIKGWLATVMVRLVARKLRMRRLRGMIGLDQAPCYETLAAPGASPEERALLGRVYEIFDGMAVDLRIAWTLRHVEGERLEAVARLCGCSLATAKRRITAAQALLDRVLSDG